MDLSNEVVKQVVELAIKEDVKEGDINGELISEENESTAEIITRTSGIFCGKPWMFEVARQIDPSIKLNFIVDDGDAVQEDQLILMATGASRGLLTSERTMLNFAQLLSGTATSANQYAAAVSHTKTKILDTRKTVPGLREAQKYAVRIGGAENHRFGLFDAYLIKENHINAAGSIDQAVTRARKANPHLKLEVEVENMMQLREALAAGVDMVLLDNYAVEDLAAAVAFAKGKLQLEASGGITLENVARVAETGVDYISIGAITKNIIPMDLSMRFIG